MCVGGGGVVIACVCVCASVQVVEPLEGKDIYQGTVGCRRSKMTNVGFPTWENTPLGHRRQFFEMGHEHSHERQVSNMFMVQ